MDRSHDQDSKLLPGALFPPPVRVSDLRKDRLADEELRSVLGRAAVEVAGRVGYADLTVDRVSEHAGVSRPVFHRLFADRDGAFLRGYRELAPVLAQRLLAECETAASWRAGLRGALTLLAGFVTAQPLLAAGLIVGVRGAGTEAAEQRDAVSAALVHALEQGRAEAPQIEPPPSAGYFVLAAIEAAVIEAITVGGQQGLEAKLPGIEYLAVAIFLGIEAAREGEL